MLPLITSGETVIVMHWLRSEMLQDDYWRQRAQQVAGWGTEQAVIRLAEFIRKEVVLGMPAFDGLAKDFLQAALVRTNFCELAMALLSEVDGRADLRLP